MRTPSVLLLALALGCATAPGPRGAAPAEDPATLLARCDRGFASACLGLGRSHLLGTAAAPDDRAGAALVIEACELGDPAACGDLGVLHALGRAVPQDDARAAALSRRACEQGAAIACSNLGALVLAGATRPVGAPAAEESRVLRWFRAACDAGVANGCLNLGTGLAAGRLGRRDVAGAGQALRRACDLGSGLACHRLALLVAESPAAVPDVTAAALEARACAAAIAPACAASNERPPPPGPRTPAPRLVDERDAFVLGIPGAGGFHPGELAPVPGGPALSRDEVRQPTPEVQAAVPPPLRAQLGVDGTPRPPRADPVLERLVALRRGQLLDCYEGPREKAGPVEVHAIFDVDASGVVGDRRAASVEGDAALEQCLAHRIGEWEFPGAAGWSGPFHVARRFEAAPPGPAPAQPEAGWLRASPRDPGCVERRLSVPADYRGASGAVTVRLAVDAAGAHGTVHRVGAAPEPIVAAVAEAVRRCEWAPGADAAGRPAATWVTLTVRLPGR
jgi:hypothetical protein